MSEVRPFAALRYARELTPRLAPPYDVIDDGERAALAREPENIVHLSAPPRLPSGERDYAGAGERLRTWIRSGVLVPDREAAFYVVEERIADGRVRRGFLAAVRLADYAERVILPHERTMPGPKRDRLLLTRATRANLEPLFFVYEDRAHALDGALEKALENARLAACRAPDGTELQLAALREPAGIEAIQACLAERSLVIADGHHRYETMLHYRDEQREQRADREAPHEFVLAYLVNAFDSGSRIQAIHRLLQGQTREPGPVLSEAGFALEPLAVASPEAALGALAQRAAGAHAFALASPDGRFEIATRARAAQLDVEVLHEELLPRLGGSLAFDANAQRCMAQLREGRASLVLFMNPLEADALFRKVEAGVVLPQKSTYFSPKIPGGLVLRTL